MLRELIRGLKIKRKPSSEGRGFIPSFSVNLSGKQFAQPDLVERIQAILRATGLSAESLKLEITESVVMDDVESAIAVLKQMKALNVKLGIDDFGTGYSSLSYLSRFPTDTLKVDKSFVGRMELESEGENVAIVRTIVALAHALGMDVIAEGVETAAQLSRMAGDRLRIRPRLFFC